MGLKRRLYYAVNSDLRYIIRKYYYLPIDIFEKITRKRHPLVPPKGLIFTGRGNYIVQGEQFLEYFKKYCGLQPNHKVLDVGCGVGRMAIPLVSYLNTEGTYDGFDIVKKGIRWCNTHFRKQHPNFRFHYVDIYNKLYNAKGETQAEDFKFPFNDESFDFV
ncbi:MAG: class I SAM-dependent methyltransferase, partial [Lentimicrobiaceae bacterium]|nr:class I SAM-dependent methyltransferase [Lentimicrobiaceae bacterium]